ncbi:carboxypeptidase-like regulatory domain-containing protein [Chondromyces apiculatus]|nr:carboxypeptidase-like regulatory domain-containing protein [Chondromyces apiculatus]
MRTRVLQIAALAAALVGVGCEFAFNLQGTVKSPSGALAGADVLLSCPPDRSEHIKTDAQGRLSYSKIPLVGPECRLVVSKPGFQPREVTVEEVCTSHFGRGCIAAQLDVELVPAESGDQTSE